MSSQMQQPSPGGLGSLWDLGSSLLQGVGSSLASASAQTAGKSGSAGAGATSGDSGKNSHAKTGSGGGQGKKSGGASHATALDPHAGHDEADSVAAGGGRDPQQNASALDSFLGFVSSAYTAMTAGGPAQTGGAGPAAGAGKSPTPVAQPATTPAASPPAALGFDLPLLGHVELPPIVGQVIDRVQKTLADPEFQAEVQARVEQAKEENDKKNEAAKQIAANMFSEVGSVNANEYGMLNHMIGMDADMLARVKDQWKTLYPDEDNFDDFVRGQITSWSDGDEYVAEMEAALSGDPGRAAAYSLKRAMAGAGTDVAVIEKTLGSLPDEQRKKAIETFNSELGDGDSLDEWLDADIDGEDYQRMFALMNGDKAGERAVRLQYAEAGHWFSSDSEDQQAQENIIKECQNDDERESMLRRMGVVKDGEYVDEAIYQKQAEDLTKTVAANGLPTFLKDFIGDQTFAEYNQSAKKFAVSILEESGDAATQEYVDHLKESEHPVFDIRNGQGYGVTGNTLDHDVLAGLAQGDEAAATAAMVERARQDGDPGAFGDALSALVPNWAEYSKLDDDRKKEKDSSFKDTIGKVHQYYKDRYGGGNEDAYGQAMNEVAGVSVSDTEEEKGRNKELERLKQLDQSGRMDRTFQAFYSMDGFGTHDDLLQDAFAGTSTEEAKKIDTGYSAVAEKFSGDSGRTLLADIADDTSGDLKNDVRLNATYGDNATGVDNQLAKAKENRRYDQSGPLNGIINLFSRQDDVLEKRDTQLTELEAKYKAAGSDAEKQALAQQIGDVIDNQGMDRTGLRKDRDEITDKASTVAATVTTLATLGLGGVVSAGLAGLSKIATKGLMKGEAYSESEAGLDMFTTAVQMGTAGLGDSLGESALGKFAGFAGKSKVHEALVKGLPGQLLGFVGNGVVGTAASGYAQKGIDYDGSGYWSGVANAGLGTVMNFAGNLMGTGIGAHFGLDKAWTGGLSNTMGSAMQNVPNYDRGNAWGVFDLATGLIGDAASGYLGGRHEMAEAAKQQADQGSATDATKTLVDMPAVDASKTLVDMPAVDASKTLVDMPAVDASKTLVDMPAVDASKTLVDMPAVDASKTLVDMPAVDATKTLVDMPAVDGAKTLVDMPAVDATKTLVDMPAVDGAKTLVDMPAVDATKTLVDMPAVDAPKTLVDMPAVDASKTPVDAAWEQATQKLPAGLSNEEQLKARGFSDEEMALYQGTLKKDAHGIELTDKATGQALDPDKVGPGYNRDGSERPDMSDEEKQATLRAAFLLSEGLQEGAEGRKVIPTTDVGGILNGETVRKGKLQSTDGLRGDVGFLSATEGLLPEAIARVLGLDYGRMKDGKFNPNANYAEPAVDGQGVPGAKVASSVKNDGVHTIDYQYTPDVIDQMQIPLGADMMTYAKQVAAWFHADGVEAPWMLKLDDAGDPAAMQAAIDSGDWDKVKLAHATNRDREHRFDPSTGKGYAAPQAYNAETGEPNGFKPNVEFTIPGPSGGAGAAGGESKIPKGAEMKKIMPDGKEMVVAVFDGVSWVLNQAMGQADQQRYQGYRDTAAADVAKLKAQGAQP